MKKSLFYSFILLFVWNCLSLHAASSYFADVAPQLRSAVEKIYQHKESRDLIAKVQNEGPVRVLINRNLPEEFKAYWESSQRVIYVTMSGNPDLGSIISSILFELHNASSDKTIKNLNQLARMGKIYKDSYVEQVERMEHNNAVNAIALIDKGITKRIFPRSAKLGVITQFDEHYRMQQLAGHSQLIGEVYDDLAPKHMRTRFQGTIPGLAYLSSREKMRMLDEMAYENERRLAMQRSG